MSCWGIWAGGMACLTDRTAASQSVAQGAGQVAGSGVVCRHVRRQRSLTRNAHREHVAHWVWLAEAAACSTPWPMDESTHLKPSILSTPFKFALPAQEWLMAASPFWQVALRVMLSR